MQLVVADVGDAQRQDGSEEFPFVGTEGMRAVQRVAQAGDSIMVRGTIVGTVRWTVPGVVIHQHADGGCIDGAYHYPTGPAAWRGPGGDGVHKPLVSIQADHVTWMVPVHRSRGRSIQLYNCVNSHITDTLIHGSRTRLVDIRHAKQSSIRNCDLANGSNYYPDRGPDRDLTTHNIAGCIVTDDCDTITIADNIIRDHYGNCITPNTSKRVSVLRNTILNTNGSMIYVHWCEDTTVIGNTGFYTPEWDKGIHSFIVVNNESEPKFAGNVAGDVHVENNVCLGTSHGFSVWGNEGGTVVQGALTVIDNVFMNCTDHAVLTRKNATFRHLHLGYNIWTGGVQLLSNSPTEERENTIVPPGKIAPTRAESTSDVRNLAMLLRIVEEPAEEEEMVAVPRAELMALLASLQRWLRE